MEQGERGGGGSSAWGGRERQRVVRLVAAEQGGDSGRRHRRRSGDGLDGEREGRLEGGEGLLYLRRPVERLALEERGERRCYGAVVADEFAVVACQAEEAAHSMRGARRRGQSPTVATF